MTSLPAALAQTLQDYRITPDVLWVVFFHTPQALQDDGQGPIMHSFVLANGAQEGVEQIRRIEGNSHAMMGCFSLTGLRQTQKELAQLPTLQAERPLWAFAFAFPYQTFILALAQEGATQLLRVRATSLAQAMNKVRDTYPDAMLSFGGSEQDLQSLIEDMEHVCASQAFDKITNDKRGCVNSWNAQRLLSAKRHPEMASSIFMLDLPERTHG